MKQHKLFDRSGPNQTRPARNHHYTVVVPVLFEDQSDWTLQVAFDLARPRSGRVVLVGLVPVPAGASLSTGVGQARVRRARMEYLRVRFVDEPLLIKSRIRVTHDPWNSLARLVAEEKGNVVIIPWPREAGEPFFAVELEQLAARFNCHVIVASNDGPERAGRVLMPVRGSRETPLTLEVALSLVKAAGGKITMLYAAAADRHLGSQRVYRELARMSQGNRWIERELRVQSELGEAILSEATQHDLVVMGAAEALVPGSPAVGFMAHRLAQEGVGPLLVVKSYQPLPLSQPSGTWSQDEPLPATPTSVMVDKWFAENTFSSQEFEDLARLVGQKEEQGLTISLGLPSLNEEETIGQIIQTIQDSLIRQAPLLDEIVLIDSGSTDHTVEIARDLGIPVYQHAEILPQHGSYRGKGEALWKSLHVLKGDLIAWIDTDIVNIHPRFVYGVLGPLLSHRQIQYVKGFYRRPLKVGDTLQAGGGGRVTELVARPLLNLFYPELSGIVQPLSGEYAGRRSALEQVPFYVGYGVETGLLLGLVERFGISSIAQVDLRRRVHHNQSLEALSRMAFAIIQVFIDHLERRQRVELLSEINRTMKIIRFVMDAYSLEEHVISDQLRPPMVGVPEYQRRFSLRVDSAPQLDTGYPFSMLSYPSG